MRKAKVLFTILTASALALSAGCQSAAAVASAADSTSVQVVTVQAAAAESAAVQLSTEAFSDRDLDASYDASEAVTVDLSTVTGDYTITTAGVYVFTGTLQDGSIVVNAGEEDKVQIVLSNASITNSDGPAIYAVAADKLFVTAEENNVNTLSDGSTYAEDAFGNNPDGAIFARCDLTINGTGSLTVNGNYKFGVVGKDDVVVANVSLNVTSVSDGIVGKDSVSIGSGTISIVAGGDGIVSENSEDATAGSVLIDGGTITIQTGGSGADSAKGVKAQAALVINGGDITIDAEDDALHSTTSVTVTNGTLRLSSGDDGIHSDDIIAISGGGITISKSYEGIEGGAISISGGTINVVSSDDGFNAAGGADSSSSNGSRGNDAFAADTSKSLVISGGTITVNAEGDGLDSNGTLTISGGTIYVSGPTASNNGALDSGSTMTISGGIVVAAGSAGMAQTFDETSTQASISYTFTSAQQAGTTISLKDASGNVIATYTPDKTFQNVIISAPGLTTGQSYSLYTGSTLVETIALSGVVTTIGSGNMAGGMNGSFGGQRPGGGRRG
ncbi:MAG: carbohydrate-binding domain-containing protein [Christensenella sp.]|nr:carbohydrate-binding domain-containing protein [Christensenella sp.]